MPRVIESLSYADYDALPGVRSGDLRLLRKSPRHYHVQDSRPGDSDFLRLGSIVHQLVAGENLDDIACVFEGKTRRGKEWEAFKASATLPILTVAQAESATGCAFALDQHPVARELLRAPYRHELTLTWDDYGVTAKARLDSLLDIGHIVELKTDGISLTERQFSTKMAELGYHIQAAWYQRAAWKCLDLLCPVTIVAVESRWPYDVAVYDLSDDALQAGSEECDEALSTLAECTRTNQWPGAYPVRSTLDLPHWYYAQNERQAPSALNMQGVRRGR